MADLDEFGAEQERIARQQAIAQAMLSRGGLFQRGGATRMMKQAESDRAALAQRYQSGLAEEVSRIAQMRQGQAVTPDPQEFEQAADQGTPQPRTRTEGDPRAAIQAALVSRFTPVRDAGKLEHATYEREQTKKADREARSDDRMLATDAAAAARAEADERAATLRRELAAQADATRREIAAVSDKTRREAAAAAEAARAQRNTPKLPPQALKLQQEELDAIGIAAGITADLEGVAKQIDEGKLDLSLTGNAAGKVRNFIGISNESSRNLDSFQATIEKLRNDSLRLNKGVQTEGDAQRAWNELFSSLNDKKLVRKRLGEIQKINERAVNLRKMNVDQIRANYGLEALDTAGYEKQPAAIGGGGGAPEGVPANVWAAMTPQEKALWKK